MHIDDLIEIGVTHQASDLHLSAGCPPLYRINGIIQTFHAPLSAQEILHLINSTMSTPQQKKFSTDHEIDYALTSSQGHRLRVNAFLQQRGVSAALRFIATHIYSFDELQLPLITQSFCHYPNGLVLVVGATGSGKSTTLSTFIDTINQTQAKHILTIEDPIEFIYTNKKSLIHQREIKRDTKSFNHALRMALRQDPDVILLGEMRDQETIRLALTAAETGHLVFATLHASSTIKAIDRIVQIFSSEEQAFIRTLLANTLRAVIAQELLLKKTGGRIAAFEIMVITPAISHLIRENKLLQIYSVLQTNAALGMQTREQHIETLKRLNVI